MQWFGIREENTQGLPANPCLTLETTLLRRCTSSKREGMWGMCEDVRWCRDMRVGRGDGSTDDADACGLRTVRHTRPEVESMRVYMWVWLLEKHVYTYAGAPEKHKHIVQ
jgi:hypothetical protein